MKTKLFYVFTVVSLLLTSINVEAKESSIYFGAGGGLSQFKGDSIDNYYVLAGQKLDDDSTYYNAYLGYKINKYFSFEGGYIYFKEVENNFLPDPYASAIIGQNNSTVFMDAKGFTVSSLIEYPLFVRFSIYGLLGYSWLDVSQNLSIESNGPGSNILHYSNSDTGGDIFYGLGFKYRIKDNFGIRIKWERYKMETPINNVHFSGVAQSFRFDTEVDIIGLSLELSF